MKQVIAFFLAVLMAVILPCAFVRAADEHPEEYEYQAEAVGDEDSPEDPLPAEAGESEPLPSGEELRDEAAEENAEETAAEPSPGAGPEADPAGDEAAPVPTADTPAQEEGGDFPDPPPCESGEPEGADAPESTGWVDADPDAAGDAPAQPAQDGGSDVSEHFHAVITTNKDTYTSGETALVTIHYTIDQGSVSPGDYIIVTIPEDIAAGANLSYSPQHFSGMEYLGDGRYKLIFGEDAATGLSGSMSIRVTTSAEETTTDSITAGDGDKAITVVPSGSGESGTGTFADEALMKDGMGNPGVDYGGYDYSDDPPAQIGIFDASVDNDFTYRLYVNRKNVSMTNVTVTDTLPDGMYFIGLDTVVCYRIDASTMTATSEILADIPVSISGQTLTVYLGDIDFPVEIDYQVHVPAQTSVYLRNHSEITYTQDGTTYQEHRDYIAQGEDYSAANGVKRVDKTVISDSPSDQWVTYTIEFWNENSFAPGEIALTDDLDDHVRFLYADDSEYFALTADENDPSLLRITNVKAIPGSTRVYVTFVCDFSGVPAGYTVFNTVGGNTTTTKKVRASFSLTGVKTVNGAAPGSGEVFTFRLMDRDHRVLQTVVNDPAGEIVFKEIQYGLEDLGKTITYYVSETPPSGEEPYVYDTAEYEVAVTLAAAADENGIVPVTIAVSKDGSPAEEVRFDNERIMEKTCVSGSKTWDDGDDRDGKRPESITVRLCADGRETDSRTVTARDGWRWTFDDLPKYDADREIVYTVREDPVPGYQGEVHGFDITNRHSPEKTALSVTKKWIGAPAGSVTIELLADGAKAAEAVLNATGGWRHTFTDLDQVRQRRRP